MGKWFIEPVYNIKPMNERILEFKGLNMKTVIDDGEMRDMWNLSSDEYPCLVQRKGRTVEGDVKYTNPVQMLVKFDKLAVMDDPPVSAARFFYDGALIREFTVAQNMVAIGDYIVFFPDKIMFDARKYVEDALTVFTDIELKIDVTNSVSVDTTNGGLNDGTLLTFPSNLSGVRNDDVITLTGTMTFTKNGTSHTVIYTDDEPFACLVNNVDGNKMLLPADTFLELEAAAVKTATITNVELKRSCPDMEHVVEYNNRLWGTCDSDNTIRCCKLGDPTNWEYFQGESIDSFAATQGTEGKWTGIAPYSTHLLFFKESHIHKVYGSYPAQFQITTQEASGVEYGSEKSIAIIEDLVFYKSKLGVCTYGGDRPRLISGNFDKHVYKNAVAGANRRKYYCSMENEEGAWEFLVYDAASGLWHREDDLRATSFCFYDEKLRMADAAGTIYVIDGGGEDDDIEWTAEFGPFDEYLEDKKIISRIKMRYTLEPGAYLQVYVKTDRSDFQLIEEYTDDYERAGMIRIIPTRCDKYWIRLEGKGRCRIESLVRQYRSASGRY